LCIDAKPKKVGRKVVGNKGGGGVNSVRKDKGKEGSPKKKKKGKKTRFGADERRRAKDREKGNLTGTGWQSGKESFPSKKVKSTSRVTQVKDEVPQTTLLCQKQAKGVVTGENKRVGLNPEAKTKNIRSGMLTDREEGGSRRGQ